jgi:hypothetical protein
MTSPTPSEERDGLVERLRARNERFQSNHGNYLYYGGADANLDVDAADAIEADAGDAATMRGFLKTHQMTPSMVVSLMMHWQRRALAAEGAVRWCRPRLSKDAYRGQLDKQCLPGPPPDFDEPRLVQSEPDPDQLREDRDERRRLAKEYPDVD